MAIVGIIGKQSNEITETLVDLCQKKGQTALVGYHKIAENNVIPIVSIDENKFSPPKVFILQEATKSIDGIINHLNGDGYLIVNTDSRISPLPSNKGVITYGLNGKASVTASSIADEALQVCIQRGFRSLSGCPYEPQEFKASCPAGSDPLNVLGAVTACAVCDCWF